MSNLLAGLLAERDYLLADGATGTNMMAMGLAGRVSVGSCGTSNGRRT